MDETRSDQYDPEEYLNFMDWLSGHLGEIDGDWVVASMFQDSGEWDFHIHTKGVRVYFTDGVLKFPRSGGDGFVELGNNQPPGIGEITHMSIGDRNGWVNYGIIAEITDDAYIEEL